MTGVQQVVISSAGQRSACRIAFKGSPLGLDGQQSENVVWGEWEGERRRNELRASAHTALHFVFPQSHFCGYRATSTSLPR